MVTAARSRRHCPPLTCPPSLPRPPVRPYRRRRPPRLTARPGTALTLRCPAAAAAPWRRGGAPLLAWLKDGRPVAENGTTAGGRYAVSRSGALRVAPLRPADSGQYVCVVLPAAGRQTMAAVYLSVEGSSTSALGCLLVSAAAAAAAWR